MQIVEKHQVLKHICLSCAEQLLNCICLSCTKQCGVDVFICAWSMFRLQLVLAATFSRGTSILKSVGFQNRCKQKVKESTQCGIACLTNAWNHCWSNFSKSCNQILAVHNNCHLLKHRLLKVEWWPLLPCCRSTSISRRPSWRRSKFSQLYWLKQNPMFALWLRIFSAVFLLLKVSTLTRQWACWLEHLLLIWDEWNWIAMFCSACRLTSCVISHFEWLQRHLMFTNTMVGGTDPEIWWKINMWQQGHNATWTDNCSFRLVVSWFWDAISRRLCRIIADEMVASPFEKQPKSCVDCLSDMKWPCCHSTWLGKSQWCNTMANIIIQVIGTTKRSQTKLEFLNTLKVKPW